MTRILAISAGVVELRDYAHDITDNLLTGFANQHLPFEQLLHGTATR